MKKLMIIAALFLVGCADKVELSHLHGEVIHIEQDSEGCICEVEFDSKTNTTTGDGLIEHILMPCASTVEVGDEARIFYQRGEE
jgi:hypothetical protein